MPPKPTEVEVITANIQRFLYTDVHQIEFRQSSLQAPPLESPACIRSRLYSCVTVIYACWVDINACKENVTHLMIH